MALVQEPRPHAGPVGRVREQPRHRRRRDFRRRGGAIAASAPARALDHPRVRLDRHLDQFRRVGAVRHIRFPAIGADALVRRGVVNFRALFETRPGRAATSLTAMSMIVPMADCDGRARPRRFARRPSRVFCARVYTEPKSSADGPIRADRIQAPEPGPGSSASPVQEPTCVPKQRMSNAVTSPSPSRDDRTLTCRWRTALAAPSRAPGEKCGLARLGTRAVQERCPPVFATTQVSTFGMLKDSSAPTGAHRARW